MYASYDVLGFALKAVFRWQRTILCFRSHDERFFWIPQMPEYTPERHQELAQRRGTKNESRQVLLPSPSLPYQDQGNVTGVRRLPMQARRCAKASQSNATACSAGSTEAHGDLGKSPPLRMVATPPALERSEVIRNCSRLAMT